MERRNLLGFTLIELLLVIGILAISSSIVLLALNPTKQLGKARDTQRTSDVNTILNALYQYQIDHSNLPSGIPTGTARGICKVGAASCLNGVTLTALTDSGTYLVSLPSDPQAAVTGTGTNYTIRQESSGRLTVAAPGAEQGAISVTK